MHSKSDNIEVMTYHNLDEIVEDLSTYQIGFETQMRGSDVIIDCVNLLYKCHKINFRCGSSYIDFADWIKKKKATTNAKNHDDKCFRYVTTITLNHENIRSCPEVV